MGFSAESPARRLIWSQLRDETGEKIVGSISQDDATRLRYTDLTLVPKTLLSPRVPLRMVGRAAVTMVAAQSTRTCLSYYPQRLNASHFAETDCHLLSPVSLFISGRLHAYHILNTPSYPTLPSPPQIDSGCGAPGFALYEILPAGKKNSATSAPPRTSG